MPRVSLAKLRPVQDTGGACAVAIWDLAVKGGGGKLFLNGKEQGNRSLPTKLDARGSSVVALASIPTERVAALFYNLSGTSLSRLYVAPMTRCPAPEYKAQGDIHTTAIIPT